MTHLSQAQLLDAAEGRECQSLAEHLEACRRCQTLVDGLRATLEEVRSVDVPEPSPLFWDHLAARVRSAIDAEGPVGVASDAGARWTRRWWWTAAAAATATGVVLLVAALRVASARVDLPVGVPAPAIVRAPALSTEARRPLVEMAAGEDWQFIVEVAAATNWGSLDDPGLDAGAHPGAADLAVGELSTDEQQALVDLLQDALAAPAPPAPGRGDV